MKKKNPLLLIIIGAIILLVMIGIGIKASTRSKVYYKEVNPAIGTIKVEFRQTGSISPKNRLEIRSPVAGRIENILVNEGQWVRKGDIIAWVSSSDRASMLDAARARGAVELKKWEDIYKPTPIIAPLDGFIIARKNEPGQTITSTDSFLVMADKLIVEAYVDETDLRYIRLGQKVTILLDAYPEDKYDGVVDQIAYESQEVNNVTVYNVKIKPLQVPPVFRSGMTSAILFSSEPKENILIVPFDTVKTKNNKQYVVVKGEDGKPQDRFIETGINNDKSIEVLSGLSESDTLLIETNKKRKSTMTRMGGMPGMPGGGPRR